MNNTLRNILYLTGLSVIGIGFGFLILFGIDKVSPNLDNIDAGNKAAAIVFLIGSGVIALFYLFLQFINISFWGGIIFAISYMATSKILPSILLCIATIMMESVNLKNLIEKWGVILGAALWGVYTSLSVYYAEYTYGLTSNTDEGLANLVISLILPAVCSFFAAKGLLHIRANLSPVGIFGKLFFGDFVLYGVYGDCDDEKRMWITRIILFLLALGMYFIAIFPYRAAFFAALTSGLLQGLNIAVTAVIVLFILKNGIWILLSLL